MRATLDEPHVSVGIVLCIQTHGSLLNWQPHIHALVTDGGFRPDGTFVTMPAHSTDVLTEAFRRSVLKLFVDRELFEPEVANQMLDWMHSGFSVQDGVWLDQDDAAAQARLARYCARCPVSLERLEYDAKSGTVSYASDKETARPPADTHSSRPRSLRAWWRTSQTRAAVCLDQAVAQHDVAGRWAGQRAPEAVSRRDLWGKGSAHREAMAAALVWPESAFSSGTTGHIHCRRDHAMYACRSRP